MRLCPPYGKLEPSHDSTSQDEPPLHPLPRHCRHRGGDRAGGRRRRLGDDHRACGCRSRLGPAGGRQQRQEGAAPHRRCGRRAARARGRPRGGRRRAAAAGRNRDAREPHDRDQEPRRAVRPAGPARSGARQRGSRGLSRCAHSARKQPRRRPHHGGRAEAVRAADIVTARTEGAAARAHRAAGGGNLGARGTGRCQAARDRADQPRARRRARPLDEESHPDLAGDGAGARGRPPRRRAQPAHRQRRPVQGQDHRDRAADHPDRPGSAHRGRQGAGRDQGQDRRAGGAAGRGRGSAQAHRHPRAAKRGRAPARRAHRRRRHQRRASR